MQTLILKEHTLDTVKKLIEAGIPCCTCVDYTEAPWLNYNHSITKYVHSIGYPDNDGGTTSEQELKRFVDECKDAYCCKDVEEFIAKIKEQRNLTKEEFNSIIGIAIKQMPSNWRKGQKVFNAIDTEFGVTARIVQFQYGIDCYNDDSKIEVFKEKAFEVYHNGDSRTESKGADRL